MPVLLEAVACRKHCPRGLQHVATADVSPDRAVGEEGLADVPCESGGVGSCSCKRGVAWAGPSAVTENRYKGVC